MFVRKRSIVLGFGLPEIDIPTTTKRSSELDKLMEIFEALTLAMQQRQQVIKKLKERYKKERRKAGAKLESTIKSSKREH